MPPHVRGHGDNEVLPCHYQVNISHSSDNNSCPDLSTRLDSVADIIRGGHIRRWSTTVVKCSGLYA